MSYSGLVNSKTLDRKLIRVDGYTRNNLGIGIDDNVSVKKVKTDKSEQLVLSPAEELNVVGLEEHLPELLEGHVVTKGDIIPVNMVGHKIGFLVTTIVPTRWPRYNRCWDRICDRISSKIWNKRYSKS